MNSRKGPFIIIGLVRLTRCTVMEYFCLPDRDIQHAGPGDRRRRLLVGRPVDGIAQQPAMIDAEHLPEGPVDVPGEIDNPAASHAPAERLREYRFSGLAG